MPLHWLLLHCYWQQELVESMWFKHINPQTCGVYIFIRNTYVCALAHFFHSRNSFSIFGMEAYQHCTTSSKYWEAFQHEADESAWLKKITTRGEVWFSFIVPFDLETISQAEGNVLPHPFHCWRSCARLHLSVRAPLGWWGEKEQFLICS